MNSVTSHSFLIKIPHSNSHTGCSKVGIPQPNINSYTEHQLMVSILNQDLVANPNKVGGYSPVLNDKGVPM